MITDMQALLKQGILASNESKLESADQNSMCTCIRQYYSAVVSKNVHNYSYVQSSNCHNAINLSRITIFL